MEIALAAAVLGFLALIAYAAHWNMSRRAGMTAEEREADDREDARESAIW